MWPLPSVYVVHRGRYKGQEDWTLGAGGEPGQHLTLHAPPPAPSIPDSRRAGPVWSVRWGLLLFFHISVVVSGRCSLVLYVFVGPSLPNNSSGR